MHARVRKRKGKKKEIKKCLSRSSSQNMHLQQHFVPSELHFYCKSDGSDSSRVLLVYTMEESGSENSGFFLD